MVRRVAHTAASGTVSAQVLAGLTVVVLGIVALVYHPGAVTPAGSLDMTLILVAMLVLGAAITGHRQARANLRSRLSRHWAERPTIASEGAARAAPSCFPSRRETPLALIRVQPQAGSAFFSGSARALVTWPCRTSLGFTF